MLSHLTKRTQLGKVWVPWKQVLLRVIASFKNYLLEFSYVTKPDIGGYYQEFYNLLLEIDKKSSYLLTNSQ